MITKKRLLILCATVSVIAAGIILLYVFVLSVHSVELRPSSGSTITISKLDSQKIVASSSDIKKIKLKTGTYNVKYSAGTDYEEITKTITVNKATSLITPDLNYSSSKLLSILKAEKTALNALIISNGHLKDYQIYKEEVFLKGEWYGVELQPKNWYEPNTADYIPRPINESNTLDIVRLIAKKENGQWKVVAGPSIIFYVKDYPNIPEEVIRATNRLGF